MKNLQLLKHGTTKRIWNDCPELSGTDIYLQSWALCHQFTVPWMSAREELPGRFEMTVLVDWVNKVQLGLQYGVIIWQRKGAQYCSVKLQLSRVRRCIAKSNVSVIESVCYM